MIKLVAFDLDGTIGDTIPMCLKALKKAVTPYDTLNDVSENDILETFGLNVSLLSIYICHPIK